MTQRRPVYFWRLALPFVFFNAAFFGLGGIILPLLADNVLKAGWVFASLNLGSALGGPLWGRLVQRTRLDVLEFAGLGGGLAAWIAITWLSPQGLAAYAFLLGLFGASMVTLAPCCITCAYPRHVWDTKIAHMQTWMMGGQVLGLTVAFLIPAAGTALAFQILAVLTAFPAYLSLPNRLGTRQGWELHRPCVESATVATHDWSRSFSLEAFWIRRLLPLYGSWFLAALAIAPLYAVYPLLMNQVFGIAARGTSLVFAVASLLQLAHPSPWFT